MWRDLGSVFVFVHRHETRHRATRPSADLKTFKNLCVPSCSWTKPLSGGLGSLWWSHHLQPPVSVCVCARTYSFYDLVEVFWWACRNSLMCVWLAGSQNRLQATIFSPLLALMLLYTICAEMNPKRRGMSEKIWKDGEGPVCWVGWGWVHSSSSDLGQYLQTTLDMHKYTHPHGEGERTECSIATQVGYWLTKVGSVNQIWPSTQVLRNSAFCLSV